MRVASAGRGVLLLVAVIWGLNFVAMAYALESFTPWTLRVITFSGGVILLAAVALAFRTSLLLLRSRDALHLVVAGSFSIAGFGALSALALLNTTVGRVSICLYLMPIWVALLSKLVLKERLGRARAGAVVIGIGGLAVLVYPLLRDGVSYGALVAIGGGLSWAIGTVYLKWARVAAPRLTITVWQLATGGIISIIGALLWEEGTPAQVTTHAWWGLIYATLLGTAVAYLLWFGVVENLPTSTAGLGTLLVPVFGTLASITLLDERPTLSDSAGFLLILIAGCLAFLPYDHGAAVRASSDQRRHL